jgi:hypothetical protein
MRRLTLMIVVLSLAAVAHAQDEKSKYKARYDAEASNKKFDPRDLSGMWVLR